MVLVTHDIEEAVKLGDRIAVLGKGGHLEQFDTPAAVLGQPASPLVAELVGADRGLKRLSVTGIDPGDLETPPVVHLHEEMVHAHEVIAAAGTRWAVVLDGMGRLHGWVAGETADPAFSADGTVAAHARRFDAWVPVTATLKEAFAVMLQHDAGWVAVLDGDRYIGVLTPASLHLALRRSVESGETPESLPLR